MTRLRAGGVVAGMMLVASATFAQQAPVVPPQPIKPNQVQPLPLPPGAPQGQATQAPAQPKPVKAKVPPPPAADAADAKIAQPTATFSGLDKITGRIINFDVAINETVQFGALQVTPRVCYSRPATLAPLTTSFVEVDEITLDAKIRRIFTGWMFADSPGLHAVEHAVYDVWLTECKAAPSAVAPAPAPAAANAAPKAP